MMGVDDMSTQDVFGYFKEYPPAHIEWIDDMSCEFTQTRRHTLTRSHRHTLVKNLRNSATPTFASPAVILLFITTGRCTSLLMDATLLLSLPM